MAGTTSLRRRRPTTKVSSRWRGGSPIDPARDRADKNAMSDLEPLPADSVAARRLTMSTTLGIALATFEVGLLIAAWAIKRLRPEQTTIKTQPALIAAPAPTKLNE